jgi:hypothetical protein
MCVQPVCAGGAAVPRAGAQERPQLPSGPGGEGAKIDDKWWGAEIIRRGARFGTAAIGGGLPLGGGWCVRDVETLVNWIILVRPRAYYSTPYGSQRTQSKNPQENAAERHS